MKLPRHEDSSPPHKVRLKKLWYGARARVDSVGNLTTEFTQESVPPTKSAADISADQSRRRTRIERKCLLYEMKENNPASAVGRTRQKQNRSRSNSKRAVRRPRVRWVGLRTRQKQNRSRRSNSKRSSPHSGEKKCLQKRDRHTAFKIAQCRAGYQSFLGRAHRTVRALLSPRAISRGESCSLPCALRAESVGIETETAVGWPRSGVLFPYFCTSVGTVGCTCRNCRTVGTVGLSDTLRLEA